MEKEQNLTPLMKQYWDIKSLHPDKVLLFRMGDFFEMFHDDAVTAAPILGIALTQRNKKSSDETPMCGVPHHSIAGPINKLLSRGLKVAICDQIEDPKFAKGLVKRAVTRILTPGMVFDADTLEATKPHYLMSFDSKYVSFLDITTGEAFYLSANTEKIQGFFDTLSIAEVILSQNQSAELLNSKVLISRHEGTSIQSTDLKIEESTPESARRILSYVENLWGSQALKTVSEFKERNLQSRLGLNSNTIRHLEIFSTYKGEEQGSLFHAINRTQTAAGGRLLRQWLSFPLTERKDILDRYTKIEKWRLDLGKLKQIRTEFSQMHDIERRITRINQPQCNGRDLLALGNSIEKGLTALELSNELKPQMQILYDLAKKIEATIVEEPPLTIKQGNLIKKGVSSELDEVINLATHSQDLVQQMENSEKEKTGISSLKIRYNNVFGYYIEITNTHKDKAPSHYQRKQTLANAERYCTDELIELERKVLSAHTRRSELEFEIFEDLRKEILNLSSDLISLAFTCSEIDVITSLAWLSIEQKYVRPEISQEDLKIIASRHPVVEQFVSKDFIANDLELKKGSCLLITGPNMAGKSTLMRQLALTIILAQMGSYVPATTATLPIFDNIFTRIGASDQITEGLSTFMVEMTETATMLKNATSKSLLILDEVGRGTSTFDGMSLAQSILEYIISDVRAYCLFATHYHELTKLEKEFPQISNAHMTVSDRGGNLRFLYTLNYGPTAKSYGIQVAELAGLPNQVTKRAKNILKNIETQQSQQIGQLSLLDQVAENEIHQEYNDQDQSLEITDASLNSSFDNEKQKALDKLVEEIRSFSLSNSTPLQAMNTIADWQKQWVENNRT